MADATTLKAATGPAPAAGAVTVDVSIVIVTWNSARWIGRCLASIPAACEGLSFETIVFDNASSDATVSIASGSAIILESPDNAGFAAATNRALRTSRGRYVFLLNPDCELPPRGITALHDFAERMRSASAVAPLLVDESGSSQREFQLRRLPSLASLLVEVFAVGRFLPWLTSGHRYRKLDFSKPQRIEQPAAAALLVRRDVFDEIGPLDEQFAPAWFEDVDYCRRLAAAGKEIWAVPTAPVRHFGGSSLESLSFAEFNEVWYRNMWLYARKWLGAWRAEVLRWGIVVSMLLRCGAALVGLARPAVGRKKTFSAYSNVLVKALGRWGGSSRSFS
jgi:GT2 family glycosyltransferase